ncbi:DUF4202 domain-containing protein [Pseudoalteromonas sp. SG45-5]|uniref:DUF4202 domain-containing protein n=1 Tax=unclassified Pseudoalteromonas TaxID=194690 RepID=UPI0015F7E1FF|nr:MULTISPECIES: DUF4202 domain-containing protein [unclassified Pseudoalteromonas]MBB1387227.1 DUF4202 domain-containing protein [Pseudoalteromonas sp. SG45-5]MBB1395323.1 DUF4202 domain-containing protein [Pseudoalteromonas sp. SG44-4]MBB1447486.1 DUF4202 domain-containing protein [Pseudoalteromonas sp. SG41-6]
MFNKVIALIDEANSQDPNNELHDGKSFPKERLYSDRMSEMLLRFMPNADELMKIAVRAQHIERWKSPRSDFEMNKQGYHQWRSALYIFHASTVVKLMQQAGFDETDQNRVYEAVAKKNIKRNPDSQLVEDVASLVFIEHYMLEFTRSKPDYDEQKWIGIIRRTWQKMSDDAHEFVLAGNITLPAPLVGLIHKAL